MDLEDMLQRTRIDAEIEFALNQELSVAISLVLEKYGVTGEYIFQVHRDSDYCQTPVDSIKGRELVLPVYCLGSGCTTIEDPSEVHAI
jgi:hypothetical protein